MKLNQYTKVDSKKVPKIILLLVKHYGKTK